jgi:hypothetical protein
MARDGQSTALQATVIVLTMLTVGLGVGTWLGYAEAQKASARATAAEDAVKKADMKVKEYGFAANAGLYMLRGVPDRATVDGAKAASDSAKSGDANADSLKTAAAAALTEYDQNIKMYTEVAPEGGRDYTKLLAFAMTQINQRNVVVADSRVRDAASAANLEQSQKSEQARAKMAEDRATKAEADQKGERDKFEADRAKYKEDLKKVEAEKVAAVEQKEKDLKQVRDELVGVKTLNTQLAAKNAELTAKAKRLAEIERGGSPPQYEIADGELTAVSQREQLAWLNLGSADGLRPQMTFSVFAHDENRNTVDRMKGSIEVTKIHGPHLSEARILQPENPAEKSRLFTEPLLPGDKLFNPGWSPGQVLHFAIAGFIDTNGDGRSDRDRVRNILENAGAVVDAEVMDDGKVVGAPSVVTRYFIRGKDPRETRMPGQSEEEAKKVYTAYSEMVTRCETYNVEQIDVTKFLAMMGWKEEQRTTELGARRDASKFRPRKPSDAAAAPVGKPASKPAASDDAPAEGGDEDPFGAK